MEDLPPVIDLANEDDLPAVIDLLKRCGLYIPAGTEYMLKQATTLVARKNGQIMVLSASGLCLPW